MSREGNNRSSGMGQGAGRMRPGQVLQGGQRILWLYAALVILAFGFLLPGVASALDFKGDLVLEIGPYSHVKTETDPYTQARFIVSKTLSPTEFAVCGEPVTVLIEMRDGSEKVWARGADRIDICDADAGVLHVMQIPLHDGAGNNVELPEQPYHFVMIVDPGNDWSETDEGNNETPAAAAFRYTVLSGAAWFNLTLTKMETGILQHGSPSCPGSDYRIGVGTGVWEHSWGSSTLDYAGLCAIGHDSGDGYSKDLTITGGTVNFGNFSNTVAGLDVDVNGVYLDPTGMGYSSAMLYLPGNVTAHAEVNGDIHPRGLTSFTFGGQSGLRDFMDIVLGNMVTQYFHGYGLPFYVYSIGYDIRFSNAQGIGLRSPRAVYVHRDRYDPWTTAPPDSGSLTADDPRTHTGFLSNDVLFVRGTTGSGVTVTGGGLNGNYGFYGTGGVLAAGLMTQLPQTHFPQVQLDWSDYGISVVNGTLQDGSVDHSLFYRMKFEGSCPDSSCSGETTTFVGTAAAGITGDGTFGGLYPPEFQTTRWGKVEGGIPTYEQDAQTHDRMLVVPGFVVPGSFASPGVQNPFSSSAARHLLGSWSFSAPDQPGQGHYLRSFFNSDAKRGNHYFAGLTFGPEVLADSAGNPALEPGLGGFINDQPLDIRFDGNTSAVAFGLKPYTKYVLRPAGLTGVFNSNFSGEITVYGYPIMLDRFAFRQVVNELDTETFIDGNIDLPYPAGLPVVFTNLDLTCTGNLGEGDVEPNRDDLDYWNAPMKFLGMSFDNVPGCVANNTCPDPACRKLRLVNENTVARLSPNKLIHTAFWEPAGTPIVAGETITGPPKVNWDPPTSGGAPPFKARLKMGYINHKGSYPGSLRDGFHNLALNLDTPLFDDPDAFAHIQNGTINFTDWTVDPVNSYMWMFKDESALDTNSDGRPDSLYGTLTNYRNLARDGSSQSLPDDPRPPVKYDWPNSGSIKLRYSTTYEPLTRATAVASASPQLLGVQKTTKMPEAFPVITINSIPDYIRPDETKISFGASASTQELKNAFVSFLSGGVDDFLTNTLGVSGVSVDGALNSMKNSVRRVQETTGGDMTEVLGPILANALKTGAPGTSINNLTALITAIHEGPALIQSDFVSPATSTFESAISQYEGGLKEEMTKLYNDMAPFVLFSDAQLEVAFPSEWATYHEGVVDLRTRLNAYKNLLDTHKDSLPAIRTSLGQIQSDVQAAVAQVNAAIGSLDSAVSGMSAYKSPNLATNPLLSEINDVKVELNSIVTDIHSLNLSAIAAGLQSAASSYGANLNLQFVQDAEAYLDERAEEINSLVNGALTQFGNQVNLPAADPRSLQNIFAGVSSLLTNLKTHLNNVGNEVESLSLLLLVRTHGSPTDDGGYIALLEGGLGGALYPVNELLSLLETPPNPITVALTDPWPALVAEGQVRLNTDLARNNVLSSLAADGTAGLKALAAAILANTTPGQEFTDTYVKGLPWFVAVPVFTVGAALAPDFITAQDEVMKMIPDMRPEDIRQMIVTQVLNGAPFRNVNNVFFAQFGYVADYVDEATGEISNQINGVIKQAIDVMQEGIAAQLENITSKVGGSGESMAAFRIDGYAYVSQDEIEKFHMEAEFESSGDPADTNYNAALDIMAWNGENGKSTECTGLGDSAASGLYDVTISTHDVPLNLMNSDLSLKEALLGFTIMGDQPVGVFGRVYTGGELAIEKLKLWDLGLEAGVGAIENYLGAKGKGKFDGYAMRAAFYFGKSCDMNILKRLDKEVADFIGNKPNGFTGFFCRGSISIPIWDTGCLLRVGAGADIGAWYFAQVGNDPATYGGLLGGSAYGEALCIASLKGAVRLIGGSVGDKFKFNGKGWGAAGLGFCDPEDWFSISDSRDDSWCGTGDASITAEYYDGFEVDYSTDCCF